MYFSALKKSGRTSAGIGAVLIGAAAAGAVLSAPAQAAAHAKPAPLACRAVVTNSHPRDYSTTVVIVETAAKARVTTSAHYATTTNTKSAKADGHGLAGISYDVSDATEGFKVVVTVEVRSGNRTGSCRTAYIPE